MTSNELTPYEPTPDTLYSLERVARLLNLSRRWIVRCARHGLIRPAVDPVADGWFFDAEAIQVLRHVEKLRRFQGLDLSTIKLMLALTREVEALRAEVRFLRSQ